MPRTVVVGLDGATKRLIQPWIDAGELPTLERIFDQGVSGELESVLPPVTSPNWKAYATGKNPGKIGVFWWQNIDVDAQRSYLPAERYHDNDEYWELLADELRVGVINVPTTYPPKQVGEFLIAGPPDGVNTGYAYPDTLESRLDDEFDYRVRKQQHLKSGDEEAFEEVLDLIDLRFRVAKQLADESDLEFLQVTTFYLNLLHHHLWNADYVKQGWQIVDDHLAEFLANGDNLVLMSDHGHNEIETVWYINNWLAREGYLQYDSDVTEGFHKLGINSDRLKRIVSKANTRLSGVDLEARVSDLTPDWLLQRLPNESGELGGSKHDIIDWDNTDAIASAQGPVYLTADPGSDRYEELRTELIERFGELTGPDGRPLARNVLPKEDVYTGQYTEEAPDIVIDKAPHVNIRENLGGEDVFAEVDDSWNGVNRREGLFAAVGPAFSEGSVPQLSILDLAPTLLHMHGQSVPNDMDGEVRQDVFAADSRPAMQSPSYRRVESTPVGRQ
jgi:predicted AlkP superfamily phosphohydrolase/phosphomutase